MDGLTFTYVVAAAFLHASWNFFAKKTAGNKIALLWLAQLIPGVLLLPVALWTVDLSGFNGQWVVFILASGLIHAVYVALLGWAYTVGDISVVYPVARGLGIAGTALLAVSSGIDTITARGAVGIALLFAGTVSIGLVEIPHKHRRLAFVLALLVGLSVAAYSIVDKVAVQEISPFLYVCSIHVISPLLLAPLVLTRMRPAVKDIWQHARWRAILIGLTGLSTYLLILWAFQRSPVSYVVALRETSVVIASFLGISVLKESISWRKVLGVILILAGAVTIRLA